MGDADEFRCGHTKIMFRAGRLSKLEEIREGALTKIVLKMQCTARVVLMKLSKYNDLKLQKNLLSSIQRNIKIYYNMRGWAWYQFYTMVKGEMGKILAKMAEEARKKAKAELTAEKDAAAADLSAAKATFEKATGDFNARKAGCIGMESANAAGKGDVLLIMDDIAKLDKVGTALLRDKKEMLAAIGSAQKMVWTHGRLATLLG